MYLDKLRKRDQAPASTRTTAAIEFDLMSAAIKEITAAVGTIDINELNPEVRSGLASMPVNSVEQVADWLVAWLNTVEGMRNE